MKYIATVADRDYEVDVDRPSEVTIDAVNYQVDLRSIDGVSLYSLIIDDASYEMHVERREGIYYVQLGGDRFPVDVEQERLKKLKAMGGQRHEEHAGAAVTAPMPGLVVKLLVAVGDNVEAQQGLAILEAMKMENEIRAPRAGIVRTIAVTQGAAVNKDDQLLFIADPETAEPAGDEA